MRYDYSCKDCDNNFFVECSINESRDNINCPKCLTNNIKRIYNSMIIKTRKEKEIEVVEEKKEEKIIPHQCAPEEDYID